MGGRAVVKIERTVLKRLLLRGSNVKKWDHNQKKKIFRINSIEDLSPFKEKQ